MQQVLSTGLWTKIRRQADRSNRRKVAIAYVTSDLIGFERGDVLVVDASKTAIKAGETDAKLLRQLLRKGVALYSVPGLHAKVMVLDRVAVIGSGNMSESSRSILVEAAVMTDSPSISSAVASLIEQLVAQSLELTKASVAHLCKLKVARRGWIPRPGPRRKLGVNILGKRTWLVGAQEEVRPREGEIELVNNEIDGLAARLGKNPESLSWIRWTGSGPIPRKCLGGDTLIQIWRKTRKSRPTRSEERRVGK